MNERVSAPAKKPEAKRENKPSQTHKTCPSQSISSPVEQILFLQRTIGNQAVAKLIQSGALRAKLKIGRPGDIYEQEADRVTEQVMKMHEPPASKETKVSELTACTPVQRRCFECKPKKEEEEEVIQAKEDSGSTPEVTSELESSISAIRGDGQPLPTSTRAFMEARFGADFSGVRLHTGTEAAQLNHAIDAKAFTHGQDIYLGQGNSNFESNAGKQLLAHELTHTIQQGGPIESKIQCIEAANQDSPLTIMRSPILQRDAKPNELTQQLPQPFGKFLAMAFMYGPIAAKIAQVTYVAKVTGSTSEVTVLGSGTFTFPIQVIRGDAGFYFVHHDSNGRSLEIRRIEDPNVFLNPNPPPGPYAGPPLNLDNQPLIRIKAGANEDIRLRARRMGIIWLTVSARIRQEHAPPPTEKERELPLAPFEVDEQTFKLSVQTVGPLKLSLLGLTGGVLNPNQYYDLPLNITYHTQDGMEAYVTREIVGRDFFYRVPISHIANFLRYYPLEEGAKSALKNEPLYRGIFDLGISFIPIVGPLYNLVMTVISVHNAYKNWDHMTGVEKALVGIQALLTVVPFIRTARSLAAGAAEFNAGREALINSGLPRADAIRLMRASSFLNNEKASLQIADTLNDALKNGERLTVQQAQQIRTILEKMLKRIPAAEREALEALYATADREAAATFFGAQVTESQLQGLTRLDQVAIKYLKPLAKSNVGMFQEIADWAARTNRAADGINRMAGVVKNGKQFQELINKLGEEMLSRIGAEGIVISDELVMFVRSASNSEEAYLRLMEGFARGRRQIPGLREQLRSLYARKADLSVEAQAVQEAFPKVFLTANQLEGLARLTSESQILLKNISESDLRSLATTAARSTGAATGVDNLLLGLSQTFKKQSITAVDVINRIDPSLVEALGNQGIKVPEELAIAAAKEKGPLIARQTLLNGKVVKGIKVPGLLDSLAGKLKTTAAAETLIKAIGETEQKGSLFGRWAMANEEALRAVRPGVADGIALIKRLHPDKATEKIAGIYEHSPDQAFAYTVFEELVKFEKIHGQEINLQTLVTELAASDRKAMGGTFTLAYTNRIPIGKIEMFEFTAERGLNGRERVYDLKAGGIEYEMKNWSGFGGPPARAAADEFERDVVRHAATKFMGLRWVISSQALSSDAEIRSMMRSVLLKKDVQSELLRNGIKYQQAYDALEKAFSGGLIKYF